MWVFYRMIGLVFTKSSPRGFIMAVSIDVSDASSLKKKRLSSLSQDQEMEKVEQVRGEAFIFQGLFFKEEGMRFCDWKGEVLEHLDLLITSMPQITYL